MTHRRDSFLVFGAPRIEQDEIDAVVRVLESGWLGTGPKTAAFEEAFAKYKGMPCAAAVSSCTAALHLSALACGLGPGDEVLVPAMTFCATANAIIHAGAIPVPVDICSDTMNMDPVDVRKKITRRTRAMVPVHFGGRPCDMDCLLELAREFDLKVIEDCAHAIETEYHGQKAGTMGDFGCFSFYVTKNITTGEGGMVLARDAAHVAQIRVLGLHGMSKDAWKRYGDEGFRHYQVVECGFKYNMMDLSAVIGLAQMLRVDEYWRRRQAIWTTYQAALKDLPVELPKEPEALTRHAYHLYPIRVDETRTGFSRDHVLNEMTRRKIGVGVHYLSLTDHPYYQRAYGWGQQSAPTATRAGRQTVSLPISPKLRDEDVHDVIEAVREVLT